MSSLIGAIIACIIVVIVCIMAVIIQPKDKENADKLFENLGYEKQETIWQEDGKLHYITYTDRYDEIQFWIDEKTIHISTTVLSMQELKAINKKCEELRMGGINNGINSDNFNNMFNNYWIKCY